MKSVKFALVPLFAVCAAGAFAQDDAAAEGDAAAAEKQPAAVVDSAKKVDAQVSFTTIPFCRDCEGTAEVQIPGQEWKAVEDGKYYPLGASFRTRGEGSALQLAFGESATARIAGDASFATRLQPLGEKSRTVILGEGTLDLSLAANMPEGAFVVAAKDFTVKNPAGDSRYACAKTETGDRTVIRCVTGSLALEGRHFAIPQMRAANELVLTSEHDHLVTILENTSGDYVAKLDQGVRFETDVASDGTTSQKAVAQTAEIKLSPKMKVNIHRAVPAVGERMSVFVIAFDAAGNPMGPGVSFCEGRAEVNTGTLVTKSETEAEALAKKAAEASETTEEEAADDEKKEETSEE